MANVEEIKYIGIIPSRYGSSRYRGKPLCDLKGKTMIRRVYESSIQWKKWYKVYVATDDDRIQNECIKNNIPVIMTSVYHTDCLDRAAEVVGILETKDEYKSMNPNLVRYIIIQGDEPLFNVDTLNVDLKPNIVNWYTEVKDKRELYDANCVKVVVSHNEKCIYFSRHTVPFHDEKTKRDKSLNLKCYKQIGVYSFRGEELKNFTNMKSTYLEKMEGIGLLRLIENDIDIDMRYTKHDSISVDTPEDRERILELINEN